MTQDVFILGGKRTPMGEYVGALKDISAIDLAAIASRAALETAGVAPEEIDHTIIGNALQTSGDAIYGARHVALKAGIPFDRPALTVNRLCGSGIQSIVSGAQMIQLGEAQTCLAGGFVKSKNLRPLGRIVSWAYAGVEPEFMGIGPVPASLQALEKAGLQLSDMDLIEVNEAFAAQYLAVEQELGLDRDKTNVNGGAIALGHPLAATGTRLVLTMLLELRRRQGRYGLATACIGGGQGIAIICETV
jgi:acetyl-CoA acetyltransferase